MLFSDYISILKPYDEEWVPENTVFNVHRLDYQQEYYADTGLGTGGTDKVRFIFDKNLQMYNEYLESNSRLIKYEDPEEALRKELYFTSKLAGSNVSDERAVEIRKGSPVDKSNFRGEKIVENCAKAIDCLDFSKKIDKKLLLKVKDTILDEVCDHEEIRGNDYRTGDVFLRSKRGADFEDIPELMDTWINFYNSDVLDEAPYIKAAVLLYVFETVHPFCDGNGRVGHIFARNYLLTRGHEEAIAVSFAQTIARHSELYDAAFVRGEESHNDITPYLTYMMNDILVQTIHEALMKQDSSKKIYMQRWEN